MDCPCSVENHGITGTRKERVAHVCRLVFLRSACWRPQPAIPQNESARHEDAPVYSVAHPEQLFWHDAAASDELRTYDLQYERSGQSASWAGQIRNLLEQRPRAWSTLKNGQAAFRDGSLTRRLGGRHKISSKVRSQHRPRLPWVCIDQTLVGSLAIRHNKVWSRCSSQVRQARRQGAPVPKRPKRP